MVARYTKEKQTILLENWMESFNISEEVGEAKSMKAVLNTIFCLREGSPTQ